MNPFASAVKIAMLRRGLTYHDIARSCGYSVGHVRNIVFGGKRSIRGRARVEAALGTKIWPGPDGCNATPSSRAGSARHPGKARINLSGKTSEKEHCHHAETP